MATFDELAKIKRRRAMAQALQQQPAPQGQMAGRFYAAPSGLSNLAYLAQALGGAYFDKKLGAQEDALKVQRSKEISDALRATLGNASPQQEAALGQIGQMPLDVQEQIAGRASLAALEPPKPQEGFTLSEGQQRFDATGRPIAQVEKGPTEAIRTLIDLNKPENAGLRDLDQQRQRAGASNVNVNTEKNLYGTMADAQGKANVELHGMAQKAPELIDRARRVKQMLGSEAITGAGADWILSGAKIANQLGISTGNAASDTEVLARDLAAATLDGIKASGLGAGSGFSNADRDFLEKVVGGKITLERGTLSRLADLNERAAVKTIERWNATASRLDPQQLRTLGMAPIELPPGMAPAPTAKPKLQQNPDGSLEYRP